MITEATYRCDGRTVAIRLERVDTWVEDAGEIVNFPCLLELDGRLILFYSRSRHGGEHAAAEDPVNVIESCDDGETWHPAPEDFELLSRDPVSGRASDTFSTSLGYLRDGTIVHIGHNTQLQHDIGYDRSKGHMHVQFQQDDPTFRFQRASRDGRLLETVQFKVAGIPWGRASYQVYSTILELDGGDLLAAMEWAKILPESEWIRRPNGSVWRYRFGVFIVRSSDGGRSWALVEEFDPEKIKPVYGIGDRAVDEGFDEADLRVLANGAILCVFRTGSDSPLWQSRSCDGGHTWAAPEPIGWPSVKPRLQVLPNGVLACASGRGSYGQPQVTHVMLSLDGTGRHWEPPFCFHTGPGCSYTSTMQRDGMLHVVYSASDFTRDKGTHGLPTQAIRRAVLAIEVI